MLLHGLVLVPMALTGYRGVGPGGKRHAERLCIAPESEADRGVVDRDLGGHAVARRRYCHCLPQAGPGIATVHVVDGGGGIGSTRNAVVTEGRDAAGLMQRADQLFVCPRGGYADPERTPRVGREEHPTLRARGQTRRESKRCSDGRIGNHHGGHQAEQGSTAAGHRSADAAGPGARDPGRMLHQRNDLFRGMQP